MTSPIVVFPHHPSRQLLDRDPTSRKLVTLALVGSIQSVGVALGCRKLPVEVGLAHEQATGQDSGRLDRL